MLLLFLGQFVYQNPVDKVDRDATEPGYVELAFPYVGSVLNYLAGAVSEVIYECKLFLNFDRILVFLRHKIKTTLKLYFECQN